MVPSLDKQKFIMIECVHNHTPEVMIIDKIGQSQEVEAAKMCTNCGVHLITLTHGTIRTLMENSELYDLIGGVSTVILSGNKTKKRLKSSNNK